MAEEEEINSSAAVPQRQALPLQDRVAIVTGGSRGIGRDICLHLASLGAKLVVNYHSNSSQARLLADQIKGRAGEASSPRPRAIAVQADVSDAAQVKSLFDAAESAFNAQPHILVTSAGISQLTRSALFDTSVEEFDRVFGVNARGNFLCLKEGASRLKRGGGGRIICLTSSLVASLKPGFGTYAASKAAVEAMVKILAQELKETRITANCVAPGPIATDLLMQVMGSEAAMRKLAEECPHGRIGQPEDVAPMVGFLATDGAEWVNGQVIRVNGGYV
ncbi:NADPH-dependent aldehyde reductase-like protein, chloroplastic isoform X1 [Diospyros lotus]|uniref:NADPH-dependent aldehyde reductase-like protein, chloroplastic isoform X1 n=1 Tax=Diospyros lotus TaxID=55363 RepID=UPI002252D8FF|nr:NADPH-dependent aldehyde reductase-like protein, chloroplastic isoform X1 [Diospyros lotus]XP_052174250.1 NADPH-dependent aldehyde reductase-like protein, chloroplastic isoform X1 [Diospyros lotus]